MDFGPQQVLGGAPRHSPQRAIPTSRKAPEPDATRFPPMNPPPLAVIP